MKPCVFCDTPVECREIPGPSVTLAICSDCSQHIDNTELERVNVSLGHMQYILWCVKQGPEIHPEAFGRRIDFHA